ncbi:MAG TPA: LacI family DNA-binding transcriptional regulator [Chloroflexia bacterium]|nr:LacI family DNA-binding transcriptional regulator [Chloroflexia bacterium]
MASIVDVAELAGVSIATASRVISNSNYPVNLKTREKVLEAAAKLNYTPNALARGMKTQHSNMLGIIVGDNTDPYYAEIVRGVEDVANENGYLTIVCNTDRQPEKELKYLQTLRDFRPSGIIFAGGGLTEPGYPEKLAEKVRELNDRGTPVITLSQHTLLVPSYQPDNFNGARKMVNYLTGLGHKRIAFVTGPSNFIVANVRLQGYMAGLVEAGLTLHPNLLLSGDFSMAGGEKAVRSLAYLPAEERPTAIFAANDETALGVMIGLRKMGWSVPKVVSVCGFGDLPVAQAVVPTLTTVRIDLRQLGRKGALKVLALLKSESVETIEVAPTSVVERESTAPPG